MRKDNAYLEDILLAAKAIRRFTGGVSLEEFKANEEKHEAVNRKFEIRGGRQPGTFPPKFAPSFQKFHGG